MRNRSSEGLHDELHEPKNGPYQENLHETHGKKSVRAKLHAGPWNRKHGYSQTELADRIGTTQALVSNYERGKLPLSAETALRFAAALEVTADELLQPKRKRPPRLAPTRKVLRRLEKIEALPSHQQSALLKTIDTFLKGAAVG